MLSYIGRRILAIIPIVLILAVFVFAMLRLIPGDPALIIAGDSATPSQLEEIRGHMGLNKPIASQFLIWAEQVLHGDLGVSLHSRTPVLQMIRDRMGTTLALALSTIIFSTLIAVPIFVTGDALILLFSMKLGWLPVQGYRQISAGLLPFAQHLILPTVALSTGFIALISRITRSSILEVMGEDYIRTARAKGITERVVMREHALRNSAVPIITIIGISVGLLISGVVVTESVFNLPGLGRLVIEAVLARDYPLIQGLILLFSLVYIGINLIIDLLYVVFDPRIRY